MSPTSSPSGTNVSSTSSLPRITPYCVVNFDFCRYGDHEFNEVHLFGEVCTCAWFAAVRVLRKTVADCTEC
ncbi:hypothetical protein SNOG_08561 [Parastagonospora nodorum SN15]|uniref:Uncharacterized protein n=1 Tax=Phaeosphaeria nodorum (strain SN15 / ATCC MYA-4574 / FGSC 10173) TaxID=321614 RepID=Q0UI53_PHANO|nr:hypothetical protein SNOG_08561 [Parastagonospora nodorum SN15]EAT83729.2 hypothetical protein SNOG_08561 [Parastagonospora nodorum SN15]